MKELLKNSFILSFSELLLKISKLLSFVAIANIYGVTYLGLFNYITNFLIIFYVIGELGINSYVTTQQSRLKIFPDNSMLLIGFLKLIAILSMLFLSFFIYTFLSDDYYLLFLIVAFILFSDSLLSLIYAFYRAVDKFVYEFYLKSIQASLYVVTSAMVFYFENINFTYFLLILFILNITLSSLSFWFLICNGFQFKNNFLFVRKFFTGHFNNIFPIFLTTILTTIYFRVDVLMIEEMISIESVGYYSVAYKLIEGAMVFPLMLGIVFMPKLSRQRRNVKKDIMLHFIIGFLVFILFFVSIEYIVHILFSDNYIKSIKIAKILSYSIVIMSINTYIFTYFVATNNSYINVKITFLMVLVNIMLNYIFIPTYGIIAASYTTVATELLGMILLLYYIRRLNVGCKL